MRAMLESNKRSIAWLFLGCSCGLWISAVSRAQFSALSFKPPFASLDIAFWAGLVIALSVFLWGDDSQKTITLVVLAFYYIATISLVYNFPIMHDSILNVQNLPALGQTSGIYGQSYWGFAIFVTWISNLTGLDSWAVARLFPMGMALAYLIILIMISILWRKTILTSKLSGFFFVFFVIVFGETFYLRINASPQTIGFLLFLIMLGLVPLSIRSLWFKFFLLVSMFAVILTHPITPLLALPGLITVGLFSGNVALKRLLLIVQTAGLFLVGYLTWTLYEAGWVVSNAIGFVVDAFQTEKTTPIVGFVYTPQPDLDNFLFWHRMLLIALLVILGLAYLLLFRTKTSLFVTTWGIFMLPLFVLLFSTQDFFDRVLLFSLVPCAIAFGEASAKMVFRFPQFKVVMTFVLIAVAILSAYTSYFFIGSVDRITQDEIDASQFVKSINRPLTIYAGGFALPLPAQYKYIPADRGIINLNKVQGTDIFVLSQQMENAILLNPRAPVRLPDLLDFLQKNYSEVYTSGNVRVFQKLP